MKDSKNKGIVGLIFSIYGILSFFDMIYKIATGNDIIFLAGAYYFIFSIVGFILSFNKKTKYQRYGFWIGFIGIVLFILGFFAGIY